ncbi:hypothetical protein AcW1_004146 [Taiwanofungus camphoratus]|nr:hypothetical protein AcW2_006843 [Antrodia cinnamomea]KAI0938993.1 hypothetical protein AcV5_000527 [Antrodia cinnamomea]KAI0951908.1 hypothetical protein AcV7_007869 [Antrodia cinnamomea]KAI0959277.1 hypothetical protein AcW1_004146 [Antrodia cinnamomea]
MNMHYISFGFATTVSTSPKLHPASMVESSLHNPALMELLQLPINWETMDYVVDCVVDAVNYPYARLGLAPLTRLKTAFFINFVKNVVAKSSISMGVLLVALSYVDRVRPRVTLGSTEWACEKLFLGAVMAAVKYTNDRPPNAKQWAAVSSALTAKQVVQCEFEFLQLIKYELAVREDAMLAHYDALMYRVARYEGFWRPPFPSPQYSSTGIYGSTLSAVEPALPIRPVCFPDCDFPGCAYSNSRLAMSSSTIASSSIITPDDQYPSMMGTREGLRQEWTKLAFMHYGAEG